MPMDHGRRAPRLFAIVADKRIPRSKRILRMDNPALEGMRNHIGLKV
jgi:hypothetical protein